MARILGLACAIVIGWFSWALFLRWNLAFVPLGLGAVLLAILSVRTYELPLALATLSASTGILSLLVRWLTPYVIDAGSGQDAIHIASTVGGMVGCGLAVLLLLGSLIATPRQPTQLPKH